MSNGNRYGISALSKSRFTDAYNEEIMIDKMTGEILVKTPHGDVVSYNYNSRISSALQAIRVAADKVGVYGDIYSIKFDGQCPMVIESGQNYAAESVSIPFTKNVFMFYIDMDSIAINETGFSSVEFDPEVTIEFRVKYVDDTTSEVYLNKKVVSEWNVTKLNLKEGIVELDSAKPISHITIENFSVGSSAGAREILNGFYMVLDTEV